VRLAGMFAAITPNRHRPPRSAPKRNQSARGNTRGGPKYSHARLGHQKEAQTRSQEIGNADRDGEDNWASPLPHWPRVTRDWMLELRL
jgi:hypothetical protein